MKEEGILVENLIEILQRRWRTISIITLITTILAIILNFFILIPTYEASTKVFIGKGDIINKSYDNSEVQMYQNLLKTYSEVIKTTDLIDRALSGINVDLESKKVLKSLTVTPTIDTQILEIKYENSDKYLCKDIMDAITKEFMKQSDKLIPNGTITIIQYVKLPESASGPKEIRNIAITFLLGLMVSIGMEFFKEYIDNTLKSKEQVEKIIQLPVIGIIPLED